MFWKYYSLLTKLVLLVGLIVTITTEDKLMTLFFMLGLILIELEGIHNTLIEVKHDTE